MTQPRTGYIRCPGCSQDIPLADDGSARCRYCGAELPGYDAPDDDDDDRSGREEYGDILDALETARDELARLREEKAQLDARIAEAKSAIKSCRARLNRA
jgi:hypothetical protein